MTHLLLFDGLSNDTFITVIDVTGNLLQKTRIVNRENTAVNKLFKQIPKDMIIHASSVLQNVILACCRDVINNKEHCGV